MINSIIKDSAEPGAPTKAQEGKVTSAKLKKTLIYELVKHQFRPVHLVMETSPFLRHFMGPYISLLRTQTQATAYFWWEMSDHQNDLEQDFWLGAEKYVDALGVWATSVAWPPTAVGNDFERRMGILMQAMPMQYYVDKVGQLAKRMWEDAGFPSGQQRDFWVAAENHILTVACLAVAMANTVADATEKLSKVFGTFVAESYLARIRKNCLLYLGGIGWYCRTCSRGLAKSRTPSAQP